LNATKSKYFESLKAREAHKFSATNDGALHMYRINKLRVSNEAINYM